MFLSRNNFKICLKDTYMDSIVNKRGNTNSNSQWSHVWAHEPYNYYINLLFGVLIWYIGIRIYFYCIVLRQKK